MTFEISSYSKVQGRSVFVLEYFAPARNFQGFTINPKIKGAKHNFLEHYYNKMIFEVEAWAFSLNHEVRKGAKDQQRRFWPDKQGISFSKDY